jgi:hypothetical protein
LILYLFIRVYVPRRVEERDHKRERATYYQNKPYMHSVSRHLVKPNERKEKLVSGKTENRGDKYAIWARKGILVPDSDILDQLINKVACPLASRTQSNLAGRTDFLALFRSAPLIPLRVGD